MKPLSTSRQVALTNLRFVLLAAACLLFVFSAGLGGDATSTDENRADSALALAAQPEAEGERPKSADDAADPKPAPKDPLDEWNKLSGRRIEIARRLQTLRGEFDKPGLDDARKKEIREEFVGLITEYQLEVQPAMSLLAESIYEKQPENVEAADIVMENAFNKNHYQRALDVAQSVIESGKKSQYDSHLAVNVAGAASFALGQFQQADDYLKQAEKDGTLDDQYGRRFLPHTAAYVDFWKKEQEIRAREAQAEGDQRLPRVELTLGSDGKELGKIVIELFENEAPNTVANFISIVENPRNNYSGVKFHRVIQNFMAQTGDLEAAGKGPLGYTIRCECYAENARKHFRGSVSMALKGKDTGDSQFFITHLPTYWLNEDVDPKHVHTVFGRVVSGMDVVDRIKQGDAIASAKVLFKRNHEYKPKTMPARGL